MIQSDAERAVASVADVATHVLRDTNVLLVFTDSRSVGDGSIRVFSESRSSDRSLLESSQSRVVWPDGDTGVAEFPDYVIEVGVHDLNHAGGRFLLSYDNAVASMLVCMLHELRHAQQYEVARGDSSRPDDMSVAAVRSVVAARSNKNFYLDNYRLMPHEIDAEKFGVSGAYDVLCKSFGSARAMSAVSGAMRRSDFLRIGPVRYGYCLGGFDMGWFSSLMSNAMDKAKDSLRNVRHLFGVRSFGSYFAAGYFALNEGDADAFRNLSSGWEQDAYLASASVLFDVDSQRLFDFDFLSISSDMPVPCGGVVSRPVSVGDGVKDLTPIGGIGFFNDVSLEHNEASGPSL